MNSIWLKQINIKIKMERTEENTEKLIEFYRLYNSVDKICNKEITAEYAWNEFNKSRNYKYRKDWKDKSYIETGDGTFQDFVQATMYLDPIFETREDEDIDFSFLKGYSKNLQEFFIKQILLDFRKTWSDPMEVVNYLLFDKTKIEKTEKNKIKQKSNMDINNELRETLYTFIENIDDYILVMKFFVNPPSPLKRIENEKNKVEKLVTQEEVDKILSKIN